MYALSNWSGEMFHYAEEKYDWLSWFDGVVVSGRVHLVKPDREMFDYLLDTYGLASEDVFFVDDHAPNIVAARSYGIRSHHFTDAARLRAELAAAGFLDGVATGA